MTETDTDDPAPAGGSKDGGLRLTRRDALFSLLAGGGATAVGVTWSSVRDGTKSGAAMTDERVETLAAVAAVVYPSEVSGIGEFVAGYVDGLPDSRQERIAAAVEDLDDYARRARGERYAALSVADRDSVLRAMGVDRTGSSPDGSLPERVRYHVVNQLLYGLYSSPTGSRLLGIENPQGYPGGYESYQRGPTTGSEATGVTPDE